MLHGMQTVLPATRQRWHSCPYPSRSWHSIKRPRRDARLSWPIWMVTYRDGILARRRTVTHPSTNWARRALTSLMRRMPPTTTPRRISCTNLLSHLRGESNQLSQFHPWIWSTEHAHCYKHTISLTTLPTHRFFLDLDLHTSDLSHAPYARFDMTNVKIDFIWLSCGFTSHSTHNRSFHSRFPKPWLGIEKCKLEHNKSMHSSIWRNVLQQEINTKNQRQV